MCPSHSEHPFQLPPHLIPLGCPRELALDALLHASKLHWSSVLHMVMYMFQCYSLKLSHPCLLPLSPKVCSLHLCLLCCLACRIMVFVFVFVFNLYCMHYSVHTTKNFSLLKKIFFETAFFCKTFNSSILPLMIYLAIPPYQTSKWLSLLHHQNVSMRPWFCP